MRGIKNEATKRGLNLMLITSNIESKTDRRIFANSVIEVSAAMEESYDAEEANDSLRADLKRLKSLSADEHDDIYKKVKYKKQGASAAAAAVSMNTCARCGRDEQGAAA